MAATNATFVFIGASGKVYTVDAYVPDAIATKITFNPSGLAVAGSTPYWTAPENCVMVDITGKAPTAVGAIATFDGANMTGFTFRWANQLDTLPTRMKHRLSIPVGVQFGCLQY